MQNDERKTVRRLYMETTRISPEKTASEIAALLGRAGACAVLTEYGAERTVEAISFELKIGPKILPFRLPIRSGPIAEIFKARRRRHTSKNDKEQAERVAWRVAFRWLQAQLAFIETGMVKTEEVFLPYLQVSSTQTLYERLESQRFKGFLPAPKETGKE